MISVRLLSLLIFLAGSSTCFSAITITNNTKKIARVMLRSIICLEQCPPKIIDIQPQKEITIELFNDSVTALLLDISENDAVITTAVLRNNCNFSIAAQTETSLFGEVGAIFFTREANGFVTDEPWNDGSCCFPYRLRVAQCCNCIKPNLPICPPCLCQGSSGALDDSDYQPMETVSSKPWYACCSCWEFIKQLIEEFDSSCIRQNYEDQDTDEVIVFDVNPTGKPSK